MSSTAKKGDGVFPDVISRTIEIYYSERVRKVTPHDLNKTPKAYGSNIFLSLIVMIGRGGFCYILSVARRFLGKQLFYPQ